MIFICVGNNLTYNSQQIAVIMFSLYFWIQEPGKQTFALKHTQKLMWIIQQTPEETRNHFGQQSNNFFKLENRTFINKMNIKDTKHTRDYWATVQNVKAGLHSTICRPDLSADSVGAQILRVFWTTDERPIHGNENCLVRFKESVAMQQIFWSWADMQMRIGIIKCLKT